MGSKFTKSLAPVVAEYCLLGGLAALAATSRDLCEWLRDPTLLRVWKHSALRRRAPMKLWQRVRRDCLSSLEWAHFIRPWSAEDAKGESDRALYEAVNRNDSAVAQWIFERFYAEDVVALFWQEKYFQSPFAATCARGSLAVAKMFVSKLSPADLSNIHQAAQGPLDLDSPWTTSSLAAARGRGAPESMRLILFRDQSALWLAPALAAACDSGETEIVQWILCDPVLAPSVRAISRRAQTPGPAESCLWWYGWPRRTGCPTLLKEVTKC